MVALLQVCGRERELGGRRRRLGVAKADVRTVDKQANALRGLACFARRRRKCDPRQLDLLRERDVQQQLLVGVALCCFGVVVGVLSELDWYGARLRRRRAVALNAQRTEQQAVLITQPLLERFSPVPGLLLVQTLDALKRDIFQKVAHDDLGRRGSARAGGGGVVCCFCSC